MSVQNMKQWRTSLATQTGCMPGEHSSLSPYALIKKKAFGYIGGIGYICHAFLYQL